MGKSDMTDPDAEYNKALENWTKALQACQDDHDTKVAELDIQAMTPDEYAQQVDKITKEFNDKAAIIQRKTDEVKERFRLRGPDAVLKKASSLRKWVLLSAGTRPSDCAASLRRGLEVLGNASVFISCFDFLPL